MGRCGFPNGGAPKPSTLGIALNYLLFLIRSIWFVKYVLGSSELAFKFCMKLYAVWKSQPFCNFFH